MEGVGVVSPVAAMYSTPRIVNLYSLYHGKPHLQRY